MQNEKKNEIMDKIYEKVHNHLVNLAKHPEKATKQDKIMADKLFKSITEIKGLSCHSAWGVKWKIFKYKDEKDAESNSPYDTVSGSYTQPLAFAGNVITNVGANQMLKLVFGMPDATPYNKANARIYVGTDATPENVNQTGVIATPPNRAMAELDNGYPVVEAGSRTAVVKATFGNDVANFSWNEISLTNGTASSAAALNRKQQDMGTKNGGVWSVQLEISIVEIQ